MLLTENVLSNYHAVTNCVTARAEMKGLPVEQTLLVRMFSEMIWSGHFYISLKIKKFPFPDEIRNKQVASHLPQN